MKRISFTMYVLLLVILVAAAAYIFRAKPDAAQEYAPAFPLTGSVNEE